MLTYWLMFVIPAFTTFVMIDRKTRKGFISFFGFLLILIIGFRFEVGGDWFNYLRHYNSISGLDFSEILVKGDVGHNVLNWLMFKWDIGVYGVNFIYAILFSIGLIKFCLTKPQPWLALTVAVPYLVIVVAMGYSRQGVAVGLFVWAINFIEKGDLKRYLILLVIASLFHKTALLMIPLGVFIHGKGRWIRIIMILPISYGLWGLFLQESQDDIIKNYINSALVSEGAKIRVYLNLVPSLLLLYFRKEWKKEFNDYVFWFMIAIGTFVSVFLVDYASTAVDRMALYLLPIQLVVFSRLPLLMRQSFTRNIVVFTIVLVYGVVQFVWLNYASHAHFWLPYQNILVD